MNKLLAIIFKETKVRFASPSEWLFFLILPIIFTLILSASTGPRTNADNRILLPVVDQAQSVLSQQVIAELENSETVRVELVTLEVAQDKFDSRRYNSVLILPEGFDAENSTNEVEFMQQPGSMDAVIANQAVQATLQRVSSISDIAAQSVAEAEKVKPFASEAERQAYYNQALENAESILSSAPARVTVEVGLADDAGDDEIPYDPKANTSAGQMITWVFIPLIGLSGTFAYERQKGTLRRLMTTPTTRATFLFSTILSQVLTALVQMALLIGFGAFVMKVNWGQSPAALIIVLVAAALAASALGTMLGTLVKTEGQAMGLSVMLGMVMALLGGCWYPLELFPEVVRNIVKVLPTTWAMQGLLDILLRGGGVSAILPEAGVLMAFALVFFVIGVWRFKYE
jgi:ABC-2 type transport system permease protein